MRLVRAEDELDVQLEGRLVRIDRGLHSDAPSAIIRCRSVDDAIAAYEAELARWLADGFVEAPDPVTDDEARLVYADELQLRGDPVGELVAIARELEAVAQDPKQRRRADNRMAALVDEHHDRWFGPLARYIRKPTRKSPTQPTVVVTWRLGFAEEVTIRFTQQLSLHAAYAKLRELPLSRQIRRLVFGAPDPTVPFGAQVQLPSYQAVLEAMLEHGVPSRLRELVLGADQPHRRPSIVLGDLPPVVEAARSLEVLRVVGGHGQGSLAIASPTLRVLEVCDFLDTDLPSFLQARLPALEELVLRTRHPIAPPPVFDQFPSLRHLTLERFVRPRIEMSMFDALGTFPLHLQSIALPWCSLDERDLGTIIRDPARFTKLGKLDLRDNRFTRQWRALAKRAVPSLRTRWLG